MATLASMTVRLGIDTGPLRAGAARAQRALAGLGKSVGALGVGVPVVAAVTTAVGGMAAAFASAGVAAGAFKLAAQPQLQAVSDASALATKAEQAHDTAIRKKAAAQALATKGGKAYKQALSASTSAARAAKDADAALDQQLRGLPPATRATAKEFAGLKNDYQKWSDSLSKSTMPVFTKGIQILRSLLPALTPLVQAAARAFSSFLDGLKGNQGSIAGFISQLAGSAEKNLGAFLRSLKNVAVGVAGIIGAFIPMSTNMAGGMEKATQKFAEFGQSLGQSSGFAKFLDIAKQGGQTLATLATAAGNLLVALGPLVGITANIANSLAKMINAVPLPVLSAIASIITTVVVALKLFRGVIAVVTVATELWAAAQAILDAAFWASPITWIILGIVALIAIIVLIATKTTWFQTAWNAVWNAIKTATSAVVNAIKATLNWFAGLPTKFQQWWTKAKYYVVTTMASMVAYVAGIPGRVWNALSSLGSKIASIAVSAGKSFISKTKSWISSAISYVKGIPGKARSALGSLGNTLMSAGKSLIRGFINGIKSMIGSVKNTLGGITHSLTSWKGPESLDKRILTPNGQMVMGGFMRGVQSAVPALRRQLGGITNDLTDMAVGVTPSGVFRTSNQQQQRLVIDVTGADGDMKTLIRRIVKNDGRGNVQTAFGR